MNSPFRLKNAKAGFVILLGGVLFAIVYVLFPIQCPYCHNSDVNVKGACVKRLRDGSCAEDYYDTHFNLSSCPWCSHKGRMTRLAAFLD